MISGLLCADLSGLEITSSQYNTIRTMVYDICGINLKTGKEHLVKARLTKRIRALSLKDFREYIKYIKADSTRGEISSMVDALTTNKTEFFRESQHFDILRDEVLPELAGKRIRIWSAGCSSGEEPYSIAILASEYLDKKKFKDIRILATDISSTMMLKARRGAYPKEELQHISPILRDKYFSYMRSQAKFYRVSPALRALVSFARLNLMGEWPMKKLFDIIFCRNVMIYFDKHTQQELIDRFWRHIRPGGYLFVGHAESLAGLTHTFRYIKPAVYMK